MYRMLPIVLLLGVGLVWAGCNKQGTKSRESGMTYESDEYRSCPDNTKTFRETNKTKVYSDDACGSCGKVHSGTTCPPAPSGTFRETAPCSSCGKAHTGTCPPVDRATCPEETTYTPAEKRAFGEKYTTAGKDYFSSRTYKATLLAACHDLSDCKMPIGRANGARVLGDLGPQADVALAMYRLKEGLQDEALIVRFASAEALRKIGSPRAMRHLAEGERKGWIVVCPGTPRSGATTQPVAGYYTFGPDVAAIQNEEYGSHRGLFAAPRLRTTWFTNWRDHKPFSATKDWADGRTWNGDLMDACHDLGDGKLASTRFIAARRLGNMGSEADVHLAIDRLEDSCKDPNQQVAQACAESLRKIGSEEAIHHLEDAVAGGYVTDPGAVNGRTVVPTARETRDVNDDNGKVYRKSDNGKVEKFDSNGKRCD